MSAAATVVVMMMAFAAFFLAVVAVAASMMVSASACQVLDQVLYLLISCIAILDDCSCEVQGLTCERVVSVDGDTVFLDLLDFGHELVVFIIHQGDNCALEDILVVEMTVDHENIATQLVYTIRLKISKCL